jgi:pyruvate formate lyase activating enzyme
LIRSLIGTSLIEYPGRISAVVFTGGCNLSCPFCHNPELVRPDLLAGEYSLPVDRVIEKLRRREGFIEAVTVTGGEPLLYDGLPELLDRIRSETGLLVKLDTNGSMPDRLEEVMGNLDYVAMDLKSSPSRYTEATGGGCDFTLPSVSVGMIRELREYEFRTTMVPGIVDADDVVELLGATGHLKRYVLQGFRSEKTLSPAFTGLAPYPRGYVEELASRIARMADEVEVRA